MKVEQAIGSFTLHTNPAKPGVLLAGKRDHAFHKHRCSRATQIDLCHCECLDRLSNRFTKIVGEALNPEALRVGEIGRLAIRSDNNSSGFTAALTHPAHNWHEKLLEAGSSIRWQYRFGSCLGKQQSTRAECGAALLDIERGEMVRSQRGTVA